MACNHSSQYGNSVSLVGVITAGTKQLHANVNVPANGKATIFTSSQNPAASHSYAIAAVGTATPSATGAHIDADYVEVIGAGSTAVPHTIHLSGDVTCGTIATS